MHVLTWAYEVSIQLGNTLPIARGNGFPGKFVKMEMIHSSLFDLYLTTVCLWGPEFWYVSNLELVCRSCCPNWFSCLLVVLCLAMCISSSIFHNVELLFLTCLTVSSGLIRWLLAAVWGEAIIFINWTGLLRLNCDQRWVYQQGNTQVTDSPV